MFIMSFGDAGIEASISRARPQVMRANIARDLLCGQPPPHRAPRRVAKNTHTIGKARETA